MGTPGNVDYHMRDPFHRSCVGKTLEGRGLGLHVSRRGLHGESSSLFRRGPDRSKVAASGARPTLGSGMLTSMSKPLKSEAPDEWEDDESKEFDGLWKRLRESDWPMWEA